MDTRKPGDAKKPWIFGIVAAVFFIGAVVLFWQKMTSPSQVLQKAESAKAEKRGNSEIQKVDKTTFPRKYDGRPSPDLPAEKREKVVEIHSRYWKNFSKIDQAKFTYSKHRFHTDGQPKPSPADMDAQVNMRYGYGCEVKGKKADGESFHVGENPEGRRFPLWRNFGSVELMYSAFQAFRARPKYCQYYADVEENVTREGDSSGKRYDVLIVLGDSEMPECNHQVQKKFWYDQATGMLDKYEVCDPKVKERYGYFAHVDITYANHDGIYIPTDIVMDYPNKDNKSFETYRDVEIRKLDE